MKYLELRTRYGTGEVIARIELDAPDDICRVIAKDPNVKAVLEEGFPSPGTTPDDGMVTPDDGEVFFSAVQNEYGYGSIRAGQVEGTFGAEDEIS